MCLSGSCHNLHAETPIRAGLQAIEHKKRDNNGFFLHSHDITIIDLVDFCDKEKPPRWSDY